MPKDKGFWIEKNGERVWSKKEDKPFNSMPEPLKERNGIIIWNDWDKEKPYLVRWYQLERKFDSVEKAERYIDELTGGKGGPMQSSHLYRNGAESIEKRKFEQEYGKKKGDYVYGAVVGKVKREQLARRRRR